MRSKYHPQQQLFLRAHAFDARYDFEYEDADDDETEDIGIENKYYNAKQIKADNPEEAIDEFLGVPALEQDKGDWYIYATFGG
jgi:COP9 signalosome complex subunit 2